MTESSRRAATLDDLCSIPEHERFHESFGGELVQKASPSAEHGGVGIPHYWVVDPREATLSVLRWSADRDVTVLSAERGEVVRAEPFEAVELAVGTLFGDDPP